MKKFKNNLFTVSASFCLLLGVTLSFSTENAEAKNLDTRVSSGSIPCWSAGNLLPTNRYVSCSSCTSVNGQPQGGQGSCSSGSHGIGAIK